MGAVKNWTGIKLHKLTFLSPTSERRGSHIKWLTVCDCGENRVVVPYDVQIGYITHCGKCTPRGKNWAGIKLHKLTFIRPTDQKMGGSILWEAKCDCGNLTIVRPANIAKPNGTQSCGCIQLESAQQRGLESRKYSPIESSARGVWHRSYNDGDISFDDFYRLSQLECNYCGIAPSNVYNIGVAARKTSQVQTSDGYFTYNGLDRVDNDIPTHTLSNVVPCCHQCNTWKMDMAIYEFYQHVSDVYNYELKPFHYEQLLPIEIPSPVIGDRRRRYHPMESTARYIWNSSYKDGDINFSDFYTISQQNCFYCGIKPYLTYNISQKLSSQHLHGEYQKIEGNFTYNGLDRVDSAFTHTLSNVVPCCIRCNVAKMNRTTYEFLAHAKRIYEHLSLDRIRLLEHDIIV